MSKKLSLLVVDDEEQTVKFLVEEFSPDYNVCSVPSGTRAWSAIEKSVPDLVLLDVSVPEMSGLDLCKKMRSTAVTKDMPIFFLSANTELETILRAFELGADDYVEKPFRIEELKARVASRLRHKKSNAEEVLHCGNLRMSTKALSLEVDHQAVEISSLEFRLLKYFLENIDRVISRKEILKEVWDGGVISARTVDAHLVSIRKRISQGDHEIISIYGEGYLLRSKKPSLAFLSQALGAG